jgi:formylglycine-generating enzyme required for sulfatase activity
LELWLLILAVPAAIGGTWAAFFGGKGALHFAQQYIRRRRAATPNLLSKSPQEYKPLRQYLRYFVETWSVVNFRGLGIRPGLHGLAAGKGLQIKLERLYVPAAVESGSHSSDSLVSEPHTGLLIRQTRKVVPAHTIIPRERCTLLLGSLGSGKSTFAIYVALSLARAITQDDDQLLRERFGTDWNLFGAPDHSFGRANWRKAPIPIFVELGEIEKQIFVPELEAHHNVVVAHLSFIDGIAKYLSATAGIRFSANELTALLATSQVILILDGLDEVKNEHLRILISQTIRYLAATFAHAHFLVTARSKDDPSLIELGSAFRTLKLAGFGYEDVKRFIENWTVEASHRDGDETRIVAEKNVRTALDMLRFVLMHQDIVDISVNPLIVCMIAMITYFEPAIRYRRVELYDKCTLALAGEWDIAKELMRKSIRDVHAGHEKSGEFLSPTARRTQLEYIAFEMVQTRTSSLKLSQATQALTCSSPKFGSGEKAVENAQQFIIRTVAETGALEERIEGEYSFPFSGIRRYLAARRLTRIESTAELVDVAWTNIDNSEWYEVLKLAISDLSLRNPERISAIFSACFERDTGAAPDKRRLIQLLNTLPEADTENLAPALLHRARVALSTLMNDASLSWQERVEAGTCLGWIGDPRALSSRVSIPNAKATIGMDATSSSPQHHVIISAHFLAEYPVTNEAFDRFLIHGGYEKREYWTDEGWIWRQRERIVRPFFWDSPKFRTPNQPVVGVSWYEAAAYASWLGARLPTEAEWEFAARGAAGLNWPWGDVFDPNACIYCGTGIEATAPVGVAKRNISPLHLHDMAGNVWEWCSSQYAPYPYVGSDGREAMTGEAPRILRGGSWYSSEVETAGYFRRWLHPASRQFNFGFRIAWNQNGT